MPVVTISRGSYSKGKEIAEKLAERLGYECISRDIIIEASKEFNIPEVKLIRALHDAPSILDRFTYGKERYVAYIKYSLLARAKKGNIVYHGLAGHFFLQGIPHVIKVRIIANFEDRVKEEMKRANISEEEARKLLKKDDDERRKWALALYGIDTADCKLYDVVYHIDTLKVDDVVDILEQTVKRPCFQPTDTSKKILKERYIEAKITATLVSDYPHVKVNFKENTAYISLKEKPSKKEILLQRIKETLEKDEELQNINIEIFTIPPDIYIPD